MITQPENEDLSCYLSIQPKKNKPLMTRATKQLAEELILQGNGNKQQIEDLLKKLLFENPNKPIEWYFEQAVYKLQKQKYCIKKLPKEF